MSRAFISYFERLGNPKRIKETMFNFPSIYIDAVEEVPGLMGNGVPVSDGGCEDYLGFSSHGFSSHSTHRTWWLNQ